MGKSNIEIFGDKMKLNETLWEKAVNVLPGGVNSPVRAFGSVGGNPPIIKSALGAHLTDVDGKQYIDYVGSWGPMIHGHNHPEVLKTVHETIAKGMSFGACSEIEILFAEELVNLLPHVEMVRMVNSGTEATLSAVRLARGFTGRDKMIKFRGCYHGHADAFLIEAGSGVVPTGVPNSAGVTEGAAKDTLLADYNNLDHVEDLFKKSGDEIGCIIVEPIAGNMGCVAPEPGFLEGLRTLCDQYGALLIFDEVMTGFRVHLEGAAGLYGVTPDLVTYGKIIGGGMPVGAYGGRKEIMNKIAPLGPVYQAGTLSGNPVAMAAGRKTVELLQAPNFYNELSEKGEYLEKSILDIGKSLDYPIRVQRVGSMLTLFFTDSDVKNFIDAKNCDADRFAKYFRGMLDGGVFLPPLQYEACFVSQMHDTKILDQTLNILKETLNRI